KVDLPMGRVFRDGGALTSAASSTVDNENTKAGLFGDGQTLIPGSENKFVYDKQGSHLLYADANNSFLRYSLYRDVTRIGTTASSAIFGPEQKAYYFKQDQKIHSLYRDGEKLFSYRGYWGFPVDVDASGAVYFIGPVAN